jgi:DNA polymerase-4
MTAVTTSEFAEPIIHIDMDSFFVEVERRLAPELIGKPVAVGGVGGRGVIASASYEARAFGVRSAMPTSVALRRCPELIVVSSGHGAYRETSVEIFHILNEVSPQVEGLSIDEAFLDVSSLRRHYSSVAEIAQLLRSRVRSELGLPASTGIASNKLLAKLASVKAKPDGLFQVPKDQELTFLHGLPAKDLWGVGAATLATLTRLGIETIGDIAKSSEASLRSLLGPSLGPSLLELAKGVDPRPVKDGRGAKSVSAEETFASDISSREALETELLRLIDKLEYRMRRSGLVGRTISIKVRFADFSTITRSHTPAAPPSLGRDMYREARQLLRVAVPAPQAVRLLGVALTGLGEHAGRQLSIDSPEKWDRLGDAVAEVRDRFGSSSVGPARLQDQNEENRR